MKPSLLILLFALLLPMTASAKIYIWTDDNGLFHAVDDLHKVPQKDRSKLGLDLKALEDEIRAPEKSIVKPAPKIKEPPSTEYERKKSTSPASEIFGGKTLEWWVRTFKRIRHEMSEIVRSIDSKKEYTSIYESGRRFGTTYNQESIDRYNRYLKELPEDKDKLVKKEEYLDKLLRRAKRASVPRKVRGE